MADTDITINSIYMALQREIEHDSIQEIPHGYYQSLSLVLGKLAKEEYDGIEKKISTRLSSFASELATMLLNIRVKKIINNPKIDKANLHYEEKFILDSNMDMHHRKNTILNGILYGKSKLLESITIAHKTKPVLVRFLQDAEQIIGSDMAKYGPFKTEDVASIPYDNAQAFITKKIATQVMIDEKQSS